MSETPPERRPTEGEHVERVERHEVLERTEHPVDSPPRRTTPMAVWLIPLVVLVLVLAWYILTTGEPRSPAESLPDVELEAPDLPAPEADAS